MGREGRTSHSNATGITTLRTLKKGEYGTYQSLAGATYKVDTGSRQFLVVVAFSRTLVFERIKRPDVYVMRREIDREMDPADAVTGYTLGNAPELDPLTDLQQRLARAERAYWTAENELRRMRDALQRGAERGARGRRNS